MGEGVGPVGAGRDVGIVREGDEEDRVTGDGSTVTVGVPSPTTSLSGVGPLPPDGTCDSVHTVSVFPRPLTAEDFNPVTLRLSVFDSRSQSPERRKTHGSGERSGLWVRVVKIKDHSTQTLLSLRISSSTFETTTEWDRITLCSLHLPDGGEGGGL